MPSNGANGVECRPMFELIAIAATIVAAVICFIAALFAAWFAGCIVWGILQLIVTIIASPILLADWVTERLARKHAAARKPNHDR